MKEHLVLKSRAKELMSVRNMVVDILQQTKLDYAVFTGVFDYRYHDQFITSRIPDHGYLVWLTVDYLTNDIAYLGDQKRQEFKNIEELARQHPDKIFVIGTVLTTPHLCFDDAPDNLKVFWMGHEAFYQEGYDQLQVLQSIKMRNQTTHWMSLASNCMHWRLHRPLAGVCLLGFDLEQYGVIRFSGEIFQDDSDWFNYCSFHRNNQRPEIDVLAPWHDIFSRGFDKTKTRDQTDHVADPYANLDLNDNVGNFLTNLKPLYDISAIEIVNETIFFQRSGIVTEKYLHTIYGDVFPIILGFAGIVSNLRDLGFDVFDDVIDHSYDIIKEPLVRMVKAIEMNLDILRDRDLAWRQWDRCQGRFLKNREVAKKLISENKDHAVQRFKNIIDLI